MEAPLPPDSPDSDNFSTSFQLERSFGTRRPEGPLSDAVYSPVPVLEPDQFVGSDETIDRVRDQLATAAGCDLATMIYGEHGVGKSLLTRRFHDRSGRSNRWLVVVDCELLEPDDIRPLLLGDLSGTRLDLPSESRPQEYEADAEGVFEAASGGTVVLDHVAALSRDAQSILRHILETHSLERLGGMQSHAFDVRLISTATPRRLCESFSSALYHRLAQVEIQVPPLRNRGDDVVQLAYYFLQRRINRDESVGERRFSEAAEEALRNHHWPGNVNELRNVVSRALGAADGKEIEKGDLHLSSQPLSAPSNEDSGAPAGSAARHDENSRDEENRRQSENDREEAGDSSTQATAPLLGASGDEPIPTIEELKEAAARRAYELCDHDVDRAAVELGIGRSTMYRMLDRYDIR